MNPRAAALICIAALTVSSPAAAQFGDNGLAFDPTGVYVDPDGVLSLKRVADDRRLAELRDRARRPVDNRTLTYVSLPRVFAEAKALKEAGKPLPDEVRYLGGMVEVRYVFVFPDAGDVVIAGPAEPIDKAQPARPLGARSGRPVLHLDDLVVLLRVCGPGSPGRAFGCTIEQTRESARAVVDAMEERVGIIKDYPRRRGEVAAAMAEAGGDQPIAFLNVPPDSRVAFVLVESDYILKRLALGLDTSPIRSVRSYLGLTGTTAELISKWWFEADFEPVRTDGDGLSFAIAGPSVKAVAGRRSFRAADPDQATHAAKFFAAGVTRSMEQLARRIPAFADLQNISDLALVATLLGKQKLHERAGWDPSWVLDPDGYAVASLDVPKRAPTLVNYHATHSRVIFAAGGVLLSPADFAEPVEDDTPAAGTTTRRHRPDQWLGESRAGGR